MTKKLRCFIFNKMNALYRQWVQKKTYTLETIPREQHDITKRDLDQNALKVLFRLNKAGFDAYLVGGCIRDILLGLEPKDFDIATNAKPEQVRKLFSNCRLVGRRFRLAHILFQRDIIEVATLRGHHQSHSQHAKINTSGRVLRDNVYGTINEDAERRDFTINAIYYDIKDDSIKCLNQTVEDLNSRTIRLIGDPKTRYQEDPVRMLRAIRFSTKLDMRIAPKTAQPMKKLAPLLAEIHPSRMYDEVAKLFFSGKAVANSDLLQSYRLFDHLFPILMPQLQMKEKTHTKKALNALLEHIDQEAEQESRISHSSFYSILMWYPMIEHAEEVKMESGLTHFDAMNVAINNVFEQQCKATAIPKRCSAIVREVWLLQSRFERNKNPKAFKVEQNPYFEKALELLDFRAQIEPKALKNTAKWWQDFAHGDQAMKKKLVQHGTKKRPQRKRYPKKEKPLS